ncbi:MAG: hypothetical protein ABIE74_03740 [Pseudomonadota bacterium]
MSEIKRDHSTAFKRVGNTYGERKNLERMAPAKPEASSDKTVDNRPKINDISQFKSDDIYRKANVKSPVPYRGARLHYQQEGQISKARSNAKRPSDDKLNGFLSKVIQTPTLHTQRSILAAKKVVKGK